MRLPLSRNSPRFAETPRSRRYTMFNRRGATSCSQRSGKSPRVSSPMRYFASAPKLLEHLLAECTVQINSHHKLRLDCICKGYRVVKFQLGQQSVGVLCVGILHRAFPMAKSRPGRVSRVFLIRSRIDGTHIHPMHILPLFLFLLTLCVTFDSPLRFG